MEEIGNFIDFLVAQKLETIAFCKRENINDMPYWNGIIRENEKFINDLKELKELTK